MFIAAFPAVAEMTIATKPYVDSGISHAKSYCDGRLDEKLGDVLSALNAINGG
jgi:hypothetical protein